MGFPEPILLTFRFGFSLSGVLCCYLSYLLVVMHPWLQQEMSVQVAEQVPCFWCKTGRTELLEIMPYVARVKEIPQIPATTYIKRLK